jgi:hypothetical protein
MGREVDWKGDGEREERGNKKTKKEGREEKDSRLPAPEDEG